MSRAPGDDRAPLGADLGLNGVRAVVLQHLDAPDRAPDALATADLSCRELRDALWLAQRLRPPAEPPTESATGSSTGSSGDAPESTERDATEVDPPDDPPAPHQESAPDDDPPVTAAGQENPFPAREEWTPGPLDLAPSANGGADHGAPLTWPTVPALPEVRQIARALRPFMRSSPSPWHRELDEEATADRAAQDDLWVPQWRAAPWRRFDVALVIDSSPSMEIWRHTVREFRALLRRQGAFRDVRCYLLDCSQATTADPPLRSEGITGRSRHWSHLVDPSGRRIVLVLTDAISGAWHTGAAARLLFHWGQTMPTAVVHTLAQRLWHWGGLGARRVRLSAYAPGLANKHLRVTAAEPDLAISPDEVADAIPVPVLGLSEDWMAGWARLLTAPGAEWVETTAALVRANEEPPEPVAEPAEQLSPRGQVLRFRTFASVQAFQLAGLLAATPLNLSTMKLVQRVLLPKSGLSALAEVMLGGLLKRLPSSDARPGRAAVAYEFHDGVREELLAGRQRADTVRVARVLSDYAGDEITAMRNFGAALDAPDDTDEPEPSPENLPYLRVQEAVFRALSGPYTQRAKRLRAARVRAVSDSHSEWIQPPGQEETLTVADTQSINSATGTQSRTEGDDVTAPGFPLSVEQQRRDAVSQPQIWGPVPLRNPDFVGRKQLLEQLRQRLIEPGATAVLPEALHGMGGVGKSQTVVEYIYQHASEYEVVWWISAEHPAQITASLVELAKKLGVPASLSADTAIPAVLEALRKGQPYSRWILVFDNADRPDLVRQYFPAGSGHIVVTSRNSEWGGFARPVEVDLFTRSESKELLHRRGGEIEDSDADRLAEALGDLPLAIEQAAAWRSQTGMQVSEYLELLDQNRTELLEAGTSSGYQLPVAAAWNVPLNRLKSDHRAALQMLQVCAFFGPEPISRKLFIGVRGVPVPEALAEALGDPIKLNRAVREISKYSLAKIDHRNNTLQLHRLVQTVLKNRLNDTEQGNMRHAVHVLLVNGDPGDPDVTANWPRYAELLPHAAMAKAIECDDKWVRQLMLNLVRYLLNSGDFGGARDLARQAVETWRGTVGETDLDTLEMSRRYAIALRRLGRVEESRLLNEKTYEALQASVGEDHESILSMLDTVAADRRSQGLFAEELEIQQVVHKRAAGILGEDDPATLTYANNLAGCYRLMGEYFKARDLDQDTLRRRTAVMGADHLLTYHTLNTLAVDLRECGLYVEACKLQEDTLVNQREVFGEDHPSTIGATRNLAVARRKAGDHVGARELAEECLTRYRRRHGETHLDTVTSQMTLSTDLRHLSDLDGSLELADRSHRMFAEIRGASHPYTLIAATNLAVTHRLRGELEQARRLNETASESLRQVFGPDHPFTLVSVTNLASDLVALGDVEAAKALDVDTLERSTRVLGPEHPSTLAASLNLSIDLATLGNVDEAAILHTKTVATFRVVLGDDHPATIAATQSIRANCDTDTMQL